MLGLFKSKKKEKTQSGSIPMPPSPPKMAPDGKPAIPDDHPLDKAIDHDIANPTTNFADDKDLKDIQSAIDDAGSTEEIEPPEFEPEQPEDSEVQDSDDDSLQMPEPENGEEEDKDFFEGDFVKQELPEDIRGELSSDDAPEEQPSEIPAYNKAGKGRQQTKSQYEQEDSLIEEDEDMDLPGFAGQDFSSSKPYTLETLPEDASIKTRPGDFGIFVDISDYEKIFKEIRYIDSFSKRCFRTVLKLKDISGNQNKLIDKFQADLSYINERLSFMDATFFEPKR